MKPVAQRAVYVRFDTEKGDFLADMVDGVQGMDEIVTWLGSVGWRVVNAVPCAWGGGVHGGLRTAYAYWIFVEGTDSPETR